MLEVNWKLKNNSMKSNSSGWIVNSQTCISPRRNQRLITKITSWLKEQTISWSTLRITVVCLELTRVHHSTRSSIQKSIIGNPQFLRLPRPSKSWCKSRANGSISSPYSKDNQISLSNSQMKIPFSKETIKSLRLRWRESTKWRTVSNVWLSRDSLTFSMTSTRSLNKFKRTWTNSWKPREDSSQDSISCPMMIFWKSLVNPRIHIQSSLISKRCLRVLLLFRFKRLVEETPKSMRSLT